MRRSWSEITAVTRIRVQRKRVWYVVVVAAALFEPSLNPIYNLILTFNDKPYI